MPRPGEWSSCSSGPRGSSEGRVTLDTGSREMERLQGTEPSVRELVRQNDAAQRGSSCLK
ncbi:MAG: hypothetical protein JW940_08510 [Polyangiaceae bacterium]|nr:hypothetical protein [Polyangiaceae bacterium]